MIGSTNVWHKAQVVPVKLSLARVVPRLVHGLDITKLGTAALPEPELSFLQHVLARLALQTQGFLSSSELAAAYPTVYVSGL